MRTSRSLVTLAVASFAAASCAPPAPAPVPAPALVDVVDPTIGTGGFAFAYGAAFLGAASPHGLVKVGPDTTGSFGETRFVHTSGNWAEDPTILCFSHIHLHGTGVPEGGVLALMPTTSYDAAKPRAVDYQATRADERAHAGNYAVHLVEPDVDVALAATVHASHERFTFPDGTADAVVVVDLRRTLVDGVVDGADAVVDGGTESGGPGAVLTGALHTVGSLSPPGGYTVNFVIDVDTPYARADVTKAPPDDGSAGAPFIEAVALHFGARDHAHPVELRVALSYVDVDGAKANLQAELPAGTSHDDAVALAHGAWSAILSRVRPFTGPGKDQGSHDDVVMLASSLYRSFLMPTVMSDVDGRWLGPDAVVRNTNDVVTQSGAPFRMMTDFSLWDTYRTVHPLYALIAADDARDAALSLVQFTEALGFAPLWPMATGDASVMVGSPAEVVLADALSRGVVDASDIAPAYATLRAAAIGDVDPPNGRGGRGDVVAYAAHGGWVPAPLRGPVSKTLEYAVADQALAKIARALGHDDDATALDTRSHGWRELYDPRAGFLRGKNNDGTFTIAAADFAPEHFSNDYVEADAWQSQFPIDDVEGIVNVYGTDGALAKLKDLLTRSQADFKDRDPSSSTFGIQPLAYHWQGNEPSLHVSALAFQLGDDKLAFDFVRWAMTTQYRNAVNGIPGNDDGGALSSWWALASLGLYPIAGGSDWILHQPLFSRVDVDTSVGTIRFHESNQPSARVEHAALAVSVTAR